MSRILLTGATGFVGRQILAHLLSQGAEVDVVVRRGKPAPQGVASVHVTDDLFAEDEAFWRNACDGIDTLVHAAWYAVPGKYVTSPKNLACMTGTIRMAEWAAAAGVKKVRRGGKPASKIRSRRRLSENVDAAGPHYPLRCREGCDLSRPLPRLCRVSGFPLPGAVSSISMEKAEDPRRLVPYLARLSGDGNAGRAGSSGDQVRDYMDVAEAGRRIAEVALSSGQGAFNISTGVPQTVRQLAESIADAYGRRELLRFGARPDPAGRPEMRHRRADADHHSSQRRADMSDETTRTLPAARSADLPEPHVPHAGRKPAELSEGGCPSGRKTGRPGWCATRPSMPRSWITMPPTRRAGHQHAVSPPHGRRRQPGGDQYGPLRPRRGRLRQGNLPRAPAAARRRGHGVRPPPMRVRTRSCARNTFREELGLRGRRPHPAPCAGSTSRIPSRLSSGSLPPMAGAASSISKVPCFDWICSKRAWFDIFYEHVNYFRLSDFGRIFGRLVHADRAFGGQYCASSATLRPSGCRFAILPMFPPSRPISSTGCARETQRPPEGETVVWGRRVQGCDLFRCSGSAPAHPVDRSSTSIPTSRGGIFPPPACA